MANLKYSFQAYKEDGAGTPRPHGAPFSVTAPSLSKANEEAEKLAPEGYDSFSVVGTPTPVNNAERLHTATH